MIALLAVLAAAAGPITAYTHGTAAQLFAPDAYIAAVLGEPAAGSAAP